MRVLNEQQAQDILFALARDRALGQGDLLQDQALLHRDSKISLYYAPFDYIELNAKILIVGVTPGFQQMAIAYEVVRDELHRGATFAEAQRTAKKAAAFAGSMRKNLIQMLDEIGLPTLLHIGSTSDLFDRDEGLAHFTSIVGYPAFRGVENYSGHGPSVIDHPVLRQLLVEKFAVEVQKVPGCLIVPLGKCVEEGLEHLIERRMVSREQCLLGFPHPSGQNGHRKTLFLSSKHRLAAIVARRTAGD